MIQDAVIQDAMIQDAMIQGAVRGVPDWGRHE